jgi:signal transduction histidine kinase
VLRSAANRIALATAFSFAMATLVLGGLVFAAAHATFAQALDTTIEEASRGLVAERKAEGLSGLIEAVARHEASKGDDLIYAVLDRHGNRLAGRLVMQKWPGPGWSDTEFIDPDEGRDPARALTTVFPDATRLVVAADRESLEQIDATIIGIFSGALIVVLLFGLVGALLLAAYLRHRFRPIITASDAIIAGDLRRRVAVSPRGDEFDTVAGSLNHMLARVSGLVVNLRRVSSDVAHDLRTPLSRLRGQVEEARRHPQLDGALADTLDRALGNADELLHIFEAILRIAEIEEGGARSRFADVDLSALAREIAETMQPVAEEDGRTIACDIVPHCHVVGDHRLLAQALVNLIGNSLKHTPPGTHVNVQVGMQAGVPMVAITDDGPGIPDDAHGEVLERFVRLDASRGTEGHGLGLSMVKAIADVHLARVELGNVRPGLRIALVFSGKVPD